MLVKVMAGVESVTVTEHDPYFVLSTVEVALMVAEPTAMAVTSPLEETVAIEVLDEVQVTVWEGEFEPFTVADSDPVPLL